MAALPTIFRETFNFFMNHSFFSGVGNSAWDPPILSASTFDGENIAVSMLKYIFIKILVYICFQARRMDNSVFELQHINSKL